LDTLMYDLACTFHELWKRPNAAVILEDWRAGRAEFVVRPAGIIVTYSRPAGPEQN
jgi:hypothetical protein